MMLHDYHIEQKSLRQIYIDFRDEGMFFSKAFLEGVVGANNPLDALRPKSCDEIMKQMEMFDTIWEMSQAGESDEKLEEFYLSHGHSKLDKRFVKNFVLFLKDSKTWTD